MQFKIINGRKIPLGAGIAIFKVEKDADKILCLKINEENDIPKGIIEKEESTLFAAIREAEEESSLTRKDYYLLANNLNEHVEVKSETITCYVGLIKDFAEPSIKKNPQSGIYEHDSWSWMEKKEMLENCKDCLIDIVKKSFLILEKYKNEKEESFVCL